MNKRDLIYITNRFDALTTHLDSRFDSIDRRLDRIEERLGQQADLIAGIRLELATHTHGDES